MLNVKSYDKQIRANVNSAALSGKNSIKWREAWRICFLTWCGRVAPFVLCFWELLVPMDVRSYGTTMQL